MFNIDELRHHIEALIRECPDLAEDEVLRADMLDGETEIMGALTALVKAERNDKFMVAAITDDMAELSERRNRFKHRIEFLRSLMLKILQSADLKKIELARATVSQRAGQPQIIGDVSVDKLPGEFVKVFQTFEPDRVKIREALLRGDTVPGLSLSNAEPTLTINVK